ncbi:MAG TPA: L-erythro-3,5-diaminohexanoate dehydrogenase [Deltaproteobacteria bacterium]|nr:MAG: hypothetical protein A2048_10545 [Deltaproteobacteria bacterium GWA2_45_12]HBF13189.1 L-erythro-3,5-diaminohexanoate dehydrogenase [Deltaproteobacteria bacterium]
MSSFRTHGHVWGIHRVITPAYTLPQNAQKLDTRLPIFDNEILIEVSQLQIDSASFHQLVGAPLALHHTVSGLAAPNLGARQAAPNLGTQQAAPLRDHIHQIIQTRGKMHNPVTDSGGVCLGKVIQIGPKHPLKEIFKVGDSIITLVSLTLTPLHIDAITHVDKSKERVDVTGHAILFASGLASKIPDDLPLGVTLAALDICGAPAQAKRFVKEGSKVLIIGLGKAGKSMAAMSQILGASVYGVDTSQEAVSWCQENLKGHFGLIDSTQTLKVHEWVHSQTRGTMADVVLHSTNVPDTEMSGILSCREGGTVLFFGMNTSFQRVVLGTEGVGHDVHLVMGSGYVPGHAELMFNLLREHASLKKWFEERFT